MEKKLHQLFKLHGLKIMVEVNLIATDFLDIYLNLEENSTKPYSKPNNITKYVDVGSNHPRSTINQIPKGVQARLSNLSSDENMFKSEANQYQEALTKAGHSHKLEFTKRDDKARKRRKRKIIYFTPPYSMALSNNLTEMVNKAMERHFPKGSKLHHIINRHKVQVSYSSTPNIARIIKRHNNKIIREHLRVSENSTPECNCQGGKKNCPVDGLCQQDGVTYMVTVATPDEIRPKEYRGSTATKFKVRHANHKTAMKNKNC
jgi:hypothetical protein